MRRILAIFGLVLSLLTVSVSSAYAYNPYDGVQCKGKAAKSAVCNAGSNNPLSGPNGAIADITNIIAYVAGGVAVITILLGSIRYITSGGDPGAVKKAKDSIVYALIGIAVIVLARTLILYVLAKLH